MLGGGLRRCPERTLTDHVEPDPTVVDGTGLVALDTDLGSQLPGHIDCAGVVKTQPQRHHVGAVRRRRRLFGRGHKFDAGNLTRGFFELGHGGGHIVVTRIGPRRGDQSQWRGALLGIVLFELFLDVQRLRVGHVEPATGQLVRLRHRKEDRRQHRQQPAGENQPTVSAQRAAQAHHELLDGVSPRITPNCVGASLPQHPCR